MSTKNICTRWKGSSSKACFLLALLAALGGCATPTAGIRTPVTVGIVAAVSGSPSIVRNSQQYIIGAQSRIYQGDVVETDRFSLARISLTDGSEVLVGRESRLVFNLFDLPSARMTLTGGAFRIDPADNPDRETRLELQTPVATVRGRGSAFMGGFISAENTLDIGLLRGQRLEVSNIHGTVEISTPGEGTTVIGGTAPQVSRQWTPGKIERTLGEIEISN